MEQSSSDLGTGQVFAIIEVVVVTAFVIIHSNQLPLHRVVKVSLVDEDVRAQNDLVFFWDQGSLHEPVACFKAHVLGRLESEIARQHAIRYRFVELV